jgi:RNA polymerase sigma-70 factor (ECF subfamily)
MSHDPTGETRLVAAARGGSAEAFSRLVERHQAPVRGFLRRLCGNHADADDLAQETFLTAWEAIGRVREGESLRAWLCGVAWRKWMTHARAGVRRGVRETAAEREGLGAMDAAPAAPDARLDAARALAILPPEQRAAVALCLAADFSHAEAAAALGLPLGTVKSHVARGRDKLVTYLGGGR